MNTQPPASPAEAATGRDLEPFEQLMLVDGRPGFPMCFFLECRVSGPVDESRFRRAVAGAAARHPLLCSRVGHPAGRPRWLAPDVQPAVVWTPPPPADWGPIDLTRHSGIRLVVLADGPERHRIVMQVHHAVCDGIAACEYFGDIWAAYAGLEPPPFTAGRRPVATVPKAADGAQENPGRSTGALEFVRFLPTPLARIGSPPPPAANIQTTAAPYATVRFDPPFTERLRVAAGGQGTSVNDVLAAAVMRAAVAWNAAAGRPRGNVRLTMPVSLRAAGSREPARNAIGYAFLDRRATACGSLPALAGSIATATRWILDTGAAAAFLAMLGWLARRPWLLRTVTRLPACFSTVVFSNVGDVGRRMRSGVPKREGLDAPGDVVIEAFYGVPPLRPRTLAAVAGMTYANALSLTCLCAATADGRVGAASFLGLIEAELRTFVDG